MHLYLDLMELILCLVLLLTELVHFVGVSLNSVDKVFKLSGVKLEEVVERLLGSCNSSL